MKRQMRKVVALASLLLWLAVEQLLAQALYVRPLEVEWENQPLKVRLLHQDRQGFLWLGTSRGLFRYNGFEYTPVPAAIDSLPQPGVTALYESPEQALYAGFEDGSVARVEQGRLVTIRRAPAVAAAPVSDLLQDSEGVLWVATYGSGVLCIKGRKSYRISTRSGLSDDYAYALAAGPDGHIWAGTDRGISICSVENGKARIRHLDTRHGLPDNIVTALHAAADGSIWIGMQSEGFCRYNRQTQQFEVPPASRSWAKGSITQLRPQGQGLWLGTDGSGFFYFDSRTPQTVTAAGGNATANLKVSSLLPDREGNLWVANNTSKLLHTNPSLRFVQEPGGMPLQNVHAVLPASDGSLWFATGAGIFRRFPGNGPETLRRYLAGPNFSNLNVVSLYEDRWGFVWLGTFGQGVLRLNPQNGAVRQITVKEGLINENVLSVAGKGNEIWLATLGGVSRCTLAGQPETEQVQLQFRNFSHQNGLGSNYIYQVLADSKGRVWFATDGKGLTVLQNGRFTNFSAKDGIRSKTIYSLTEDEKGNIWFSTLQAGIYCFNGSSFKNYGLKEGLRDLNISTLRADKAGNILVLHRQGLDLLHVQTGQVQYFGAEAGIGEPDPDLNVAGTDGSGRIWLGTRNGLVCYDPALAPQQRRPHTRLQEVQVFFRPVAQQQQSTFAHHENHLTFSYAGLWYRNPAEVTYRVKLEGYDRDWTNSRNHTVTYPNLPPGHYVFRVCASATPDFSGAGVVEYRFSIKPPFWNTFWFYLLALALCSSGLYAFVKGREKRLKKAERLEKDKVMFQFETLKSQVNPHFLFNSFNTLISTIEEDPQAAVAYVENLSDFFRDMLMYREKDVISLQEELALVRNYAFLQQKRYGRNLEVQVQVPEEKLEAQVAPLTLQLLVENAIKHNIISKLRPLRIFIFTEGEELVVRNNLQVKKTPEVSTKVGLQNIRSRYQILSRREIRILQTEEHYEVRIPLLKTAKTAEYERIDY